MKLATLLSEDQILLDMKAEDHWPAIEELVHQLVKVGKLPLTLRDDCLEALRTREDLVSTGIGGGVAIPHAFSEELDEVITVFGRSVRGIDFSAIDDQPVHFIILFIVPRTHYHLHLRTLAAIAKMFTNRGVRERLAAAEDYAEILRILDPRSYRQALPERS